MKHQAAINLLKTRIDLLYPELEKAKGIVDNPEMMADYHFAVSDVENINTEIASLQHSIETLLR